jgi:hypothetical protein
LVEPEGKIPPTRPRHGWEDNIEVGHKEGWQGLDWNNVSQDTDRWWAVTNTIMNFLFPKNVGNSLTSGGTFSFSRKTAE